MIGLSSLLERVPTSVRVKIGLRALGLSDEERTELDTLISDVLGTPAVGVILGRDLKTATDVVNYVVELTEGSPGKFKKMESLLPLAKPFLSSDAGRMQVAGFLVKFLDATGKHKESLVRLIASMTRSDLFAGREYKSVQEFLAFGVLPMVDKLIPTTINSQVTPHECEFCGHMQGTLI
jgi:hypothetical protein